LCEIFGAQGRGIPVDLGRSFIAAFRLGLLDTEYTQLALPRLSTPLDPGDTIDLAGNELVSSPDINFNYGIDYEIPIGPNWNLRFHVNDNYVGDQWFSAYNALDGHAEIRQDAYHVHDARVTFASEDEHLTFSLWGQNVFDEEFEVFAINLQSGFGYNYFLEGRPRTYGAEFTYNFR
jgi:iron complex outermembrane receptor protein